MQCLLEILCIKIILYNIFYEKFDVLLTIINFITDTKMTELNSQLVEKFLIVGLITSSEFQKAQFIVKKLHTSYPMNYEKPEIRPMLDVEWDVYITKVFSNISMNRFQQ